MKKLILNLEEQELDENDNPSRHRIIQLSSIFEFDKMKEFWLECAVKELVESYNAVIYNDNGFTTIEDKLADHDKEVRKQVCDEIRNKFIDILNVNDGHYSYEQLDDDFNNILDQIEKGE